MKQTKHSEMKLIDVKTNDRMRIQDGTFVLFNNVIFICNDMVVSTRKHYVLSEKLKKIEITKKGREEIYKKLHQIDSKYKIQNMLNPYGFMIE